MRRLIIPLSVAAMLACPAGASAAKKPVKLNFKVEGTQTTDWKYIKQQQPSCDWPETGQGKQVIKFESIKKGVTLEATPSGNGIKFDEKGFLLAADAKLTSSWDRLFSQISPCPDGGSYGGDGTNEDAHGNAKCDILGSIEFRVATDRHSLYDPGDPLMPKSRGNKDRLYFRGLGAWQGPENNTNLPSACSASGQENADIGLSYGPIEWSGGLVETGDKVKTKDLLTKKKTKIAGQVVVKYPNKQFPEAGPSKTTGTTTLEIKITVTRAK